MHLSSFKSLSIFSAVFNSSCALGEGKFTLISLILLRIVASHKPWFRLPGLMCRNIPLYAPFQHDVQYLLHTTYIVALFLYFGYRCISIIPLQNHWLIFSLTVNASSQRFNLTRQSIKMHFWYTAHFLLLLEKIFSVVKLLLVWLSLIFCPNSIIMFAFRRLKKGW